MLAQTIAAGYNSLKGTNFKKELEKLQFRGIM